LSPFFQGALEVARAAIRRPEEQVRRPSRQVAGKRRPIDERKRVIGEYKSHEEKLAQALKERLTVLRAMRGFKRARP
jgi:vacuolar-type H+-ATPase subunit I/STV1